MFLWGDLRGDAWRPFWICYDHDDDGRHAIGSPVIWVGYEVYLTIGFLDHPEQFHP